VEGTLPEVREYGVRIGVGESGWCRLSLRGGVVSESDEESSEWESGGASGDG
jgi:hypothetical protein